jgi:hypothetical protein
VTKDRLENLVKIAKSVQSTRELSEKLKRDKEYEDKYATLGDLAKPYIDDLFTQIEEGAKVGQIEYKINNLPKDNFVLDFHFIVSSDDNINVSVKSNTITSKVMEILKNYNLRYEKLYDKGNSLGYLKVIL